MQQWSSSPGHCERALNKCSLRMRGSYKSNDCKASRWTAVAAHPAILRKSDSKLTDHAHLPVVSRIQRCNSASDLASAETPRSKNRPLVKVYRKSGISKVVCFVFAVYRLTLVVKLTASNLTHVAAKAFQPTITEAPRSGSAFKALIECLHIVGHCTHY